MVRLDESRKDRPLSLYTGEVRDDKARLDPSFSLHPVDRGKRRVSARSAECTWDFPPTTRGELRCQTHGDAHSRILLYPDAKGRPSTLRMLLAGGRLTGEALVEAGGTGT